MVKAAEDAAEVVVGAVEAALPLAQESESPSPMAPARRLL